MMKLAAIFGIVFLVSQCSSIAMPESPLALERAGQLAAMSLKGAVSLDGRSKREATSAEKQKLNKAIDNLLSLWDKMVELAKTCALRMACTIGAEDTYSLTEPERKLQGLIADDKISQVIMLYPYKEYLKGKFFLTAGKLGSVSRSLKTCENMFHCTTRGNAVIRNAFNKVYENDL